MKTAMSSWYGTRFQTQKLYCHIVEYLWNHIQVDPSIIHESMAGEELENSFQESAQADLKQPTMQAWPCHKLLMVVDV